MAEEILEFTLEVNGVQQAITSVEDLEEAVVQLQDQINSGQYGADKIAELNSNVDTGKTKLEAMKTASKEAGESAERGGVDGGKAIGLFRESFDGAARAASRQGESIHGRARARAVDLNDRRGAEQRVCACVQYHRRSDRWQT